MKENLRKVLLSILEDGLICLRGRSKNSEYVAAESDHLHNFPSLIRDPSVDRVLYYYTVERKLYLEALNKIGVAHVYEEAWGAIEKFLQSNRN